MNKAAEYKRLMAEAFQAMKITLLDPTTTVNEMVAALTTLADIVAHPAPDDPASQTLRTQCREMYRRIRGIIIASPNTRATFLVAAEVCRDMLGLLDVPYEER